MGNWLDHWSLKRDPFDARRSAFVATSGHVEAVARLVHTIETAGRSARLIAGPGLGKTRVLARAVETTRSPERRFARISCPSDGADLFGRLATELGSRVAPGSSRTVTWRALTDAVRLCRWQGLQVILAVDDCQCLATESDRRDLERLEAIDHDPSTRLTVLRLARPDESSTNDWDQLISSHDWSLAVRLEPLTRAETADYLATKLEFAGRSEPTFTPRAITRIQSVTEGVPRGIDRIASLALMASAFRGLEMVPPDVVDEAIGESPVIGPVESRL